MSELRNLAKLAYENGISVATGAIFGVFNVINAILFANSGDAVWSVITFAISVGCFYIARKAYKAHREGMRSLPE